MEPNKAQSIADQDTSQNTVRIERAGNGYIVRVPRMRPMVFFELVEVFKLTKGFFDGK